MEIKGRLQADLARLTLTDIGIRDFRDRTGDEPLFEQVLMGEDVFRGHCIAAAPDLIIIPRRGYDVKATVNASAASTRDIFTGMHTHDDAFLMMDDPALLERLPEPKISDVAGLVMEWSR